MPGKSAKKEDKKSKAPPADVPAKGYWQSPQQIYDACRTTWRKFEREKVDLQAILKDVPISYFNRGERTDKLSDYDRLFHCIEEFDPKKQREDRQNIAVIRNRIFDEEKERTFPIVVSHTYGHRNTNLEGKTWLNCKKVETMNETRRRWYINLKPNKKLPSNNKVDSL